MLLCICKHGTGQKSLKFDRARESVFLILPIVECSLTAPVMIVIWTVDAHEADPRECRAQHSNSRRHDDTYSFSIFLLLPLACVGKCGDSLRLNAVMGQVIDILVEFKRTSPARSTVRVTLRCAHSHSHNCQLSQKKVNCFLVLAQGFIS